MSLTFSVKAGKKFYNLSLPTTATVKDLKLAFSKESKKDINRISLKAGLIRLDDDAKTLAKDYSLSNGSEITFKDLGPQIGYRTVFLVEYFGPILFVGLYALRPALIYGPNANASPFNTVALTGVICWIAHFVKREFETVFIHKFSRPTMPLTNLFKNCAYYWSFGAVIGYPLCSPSYVAPSSEIVFKAGLAIFVLSEIGNLICHIMLSNLRPADGSKKRPIPTGFLFNYVACPNYTFEVLSWVGFSLFTGIPFSWGFTLVGLLQMGDWALKKHREYKKTYDKEYVQLKRKAIIPFIF